jgi:glycosyltransferase involved in cell wall biosynthesis
MSEDALLVSRPQPALAASAALNHADDTGPAPHRCRIVLVQTQAEGAGAQEISRILGQGLERLGYDVHHVFFFRRTAAFDHQPNTLFCARERPSNPVELLRMLAALVRHLKDLQPDVVMCFQHYGNVIGALAARLAGIRVIIANRTSAKMHMPWWIRWIELSLGMGGLFKRIVVNCATIAHEYRGYPHRYRDRVLRIDHGFEAKTSTLDRRDARASLGLPSDATILGSVARLHPCKNLGTAIKLLPFDAGWHLALAGQGPARDELAGLAKSLGVAERVHFVGELSATGVGTFLRTLDVFVFPTIAETFGLAGVEAAQAGIPVVANDLLVLREVLAVDGEPCALFVDADHSAAFVGAVRRLLSDTRLSAAMSSRGRRLSHRYSLDSMVRQYAALIEELVPRSSNGGGDARPSR